MNDKQKQVFELISNDEWLLDLRFSVDIVKKLNQSNRYIISGKR